MRRGKRARDPDRRCRRCEMRGDGMGTSSISSPSSAMHVATNTLISPLLKDWVSNGRGREERRGKREILC